jgi:hypothetical protein
MTLSTRHIKAIIVGVIAIVLGSVGGSIWYFKDNIRTAIYRPFRQAATLSQAKSSPPTQITVKQTLLNAPVTKSTPEIVRVTKVREVHVVQPVMTKRKLSSFCKYDAYKDTPRCRK